MSAVLAGQQMEITLILEQLEMALLKFLYLRQIIHLLPHVQMQQEFFGLQRLQHLMLLQRTQRFSSI